MSRSREKSSLKSSGYRGFQVPARATEYVASCQLEVSVGSAKEGAAKSELNLPIPVIPSVEPSEG